MPSHCSPPEITLDESQVKDAADFLKDNLNVKGFISATRGRFAEIFEILKEAVVNKHDPGHQWRTALNAVMIMRKFNFSHKETVLASAAALFHDVGYFTEEDIEEASNSPDSDDSLSQRKARFKRHALLGAKEVDKKIKRMLTFIQKRGLNERAMVSRLVKKCQDLLSYKDGEGQMQPLTEEDVQLIVESILNHNDYGKDNALYNPHAVSKAALAVQIGDKLDNCRARIYPDHMKNPNVFIEGSADFDSHYYHRSVSYCIKNYNLDLKAEGKLRVVYHVNLDDFEKIVQKASPDFNYSKDKFEADFKKAYTKSCSVASEAMGVILGQPTDGPNLEVVLSFEDGENRALLFHGPDRTKIEPQLKAA